MRSLATPGHPAEIRVRRITLDHPWRWLTAGWTDMQLDPGASYLYGASFALVGFLLLVGLEHYDLGYLILPLAVGFALVGPAAAVGLYESSRMQEAGIRPEMADLLLAFRRNPGQIALIGLVLALVMLVWARVAMLEFFLFFGPESPPVDGLIEAFLVSDQSVVFLAVGTLSGAAMALLVFALTAIAIPMLIDRPDCDAVTAMLTSVEAVRVNPAPMMLWAFLISFFTFFGLAMFFVGLTITLPLLGHASWHAYRDIVRHQ